MSQPNEQVHNNEESTSQIGGCTGKGWLPGQSGNPGGRPKKRPISDIYEKIMDDPENVAKITEAVIKTVISGRMAAQLQLKEMRECIEGKTVQQVEINGELTLTLSDRIEKARQKLNE